MKIKYTITGIDCPNCAGKLALQLAKQHQRIGKGGLITVKNGDGNHCIESKSRDGAGLIAAAAEGGAEKKKCGDQRYYTDGLFHV